MFGGPISCASINAMRSAGPDLVSGNLHALWLDIVVPIVGASLGALAHQSPPRHRPPTTRRMGSANQPRP
jgi:glycerol uptake facilitator-like aquaporin